MRCVLCVKNSKSLVNMKPANRVQQVQEYYFSRKLKEVARLNAEGKNIISLAIGSPDQPPSPATIDTLCRVAQDSAAHGYQPYVGIPELRQAMAGFYERHYGVTLDPATEIQPLIGSKEGILHITLAFVNPGEAVLVPDPGYPTYTSLSELLGAKVIKYNLRPENDWQPDFEEMEHLIQEHHPRLIWMNYPHMPTGTKATRATYERYVALARQYDTVVVNDNPYSFILNREPMSLLQIPGAKDCCIEMNSMSKSHNMPGWRVGLLASNAEFVQWVLKVKSNIDSGTFRAIQVAAAEAYANSDEWHQEYSYNVYARRRALCEQILQVLGCTFDPNQMGMFLWARIPEHYATCEELTERILHEARVFITPGFIFGQNGERYIRLSLCAKEPQIEEALRRIKAIVLKH